MLSLYFFQAEDAKDSCVDDIKEEEEEEEEFDAKKEVGMIFNCLYTLVFIWYTPLAYAVTWMVHQFGMLPVEQKCMPLVNFK